MTIELYSHNQETYNKIQEMWKSTNRVSAIQATGTGKSFLILKCLFDLLDKDKVVLAPSEYIFEQLVKNSGKEEIPNTKFITYSKLSYMTEEEMRFINPSLIVLDEFHRCGAEQWGRGVENLLSLFPNTKILGTSATPIRYLDNERDMSDELFEGNIAVNLSLAEAIVKGVLPMPKYISALYTFDEEIDNLKNKVVNSHNTEEEKENLLEQINLMRNKLDRSKGIPKILKKYLSDNNGKFIVFCKNKEHLYEMKEVVVNWFKKSKLFKKIKTYIVYKGYKNTDEEFQAFKNNDNNNLKLLFSIEMLNEGIHVENITGVILLRPTISPIIYYQQIGRAIDAGSKEQPLIFDFVNNFDNIGAKNFIKDLNDNREKEIRERNEREESEDIDVPEFILYDEILEVKELFNKMENNLHLKGDWNEWYEKLKQYVKKNGNSNVPENHYDKKLYRWVRTQRVNYSKNLLSKERIMKLNDIDFIWNTIDNEWKIMFNALKNFYLEYGHTSVNKSTIKNFDDKYEKLKNWISYQRRNFSILSQEKIEKLNSINFKWNVYDEKWEEMYLVLIEYFKKYGTYSMISRFVYNDKNLGMWVYNQRRFYKNNQLTLDKIEKLNKIGFTWDN